MHLSIRPQNGAVRINNNRRIVIQSRRPLFKQRNNQNNPQLLGHRLHLLRLRTRYRLRKFEILLFLSLTEILRGKHLLQADDLRTPSGRFSNQLFRSGDVSRHRRPASHLDESDLEPAIFLNFSDRHSYVVY